MVAEIRGQQRHRAMGYVAHSSVLGGFFLVLLRFPGLRGQVFLRIAVKQSPLLMVKA